MRRAGTVTRLGTRHDGVFRGVKSKSGLAKKAEYTVKINRDWMGCPGWFGKG
jgi:hypothetical protein